MVDVALLTEARFAASRAEGDGYLANILLDDRLLGDALRALGLSSVRVDWNRSDVDWSTFRCAMFRTTWNYFTKFPDFVAWLARVEGQTRILNVPSIVRWNWDKHYFADLEAQGIPVVPSRYIERGEARTLGDLLEETGWEDAIVKPCVSGGAYHTYRIHRGNAAEVDAAVRGLLDDGALLLQPFQDDIVRTGEDTLMVLGGRYTHAVRKKAKAGDFRVQDDFGGTVHRLEPTLEQKELAERAMAACARGARPAPVYGRVDMVRGNDGRYTVMELELIEPELWLRYHPPAADVLAEAIARALEHGPEAGQPSTAEPRPSGSR
jgi:glutathione synthase/RimK-type ligase-like ATP-grasp enzyme